MKIGIDIRLIGKKRTGDEAVFFNLVKNLASIDLENEYFLFTDIKDKEMIGEISSKLEIIGKENFKIITLATSSKFCWNFWTLPNYLRKNPVDIYQTQYITPFFVPRKIKIVTIIHDISFNFFPQFIRFSDLFFLKILIPLSIRRANKVIGVSKFTQDEIIRYYRTDANKVTCVHNAVDDDWKSGDKPDENKMKAVRKKYRLPEKFILYVGTLQPRKNVPQLIDAFARIENKLDGVQLVIGGNKGAHNFDNRIDAAVLKNNLAESVLFAGFVEEEDKKALFRLARAFVFPSLYEGFGIPVLEAMSQGVPVICSDIPSLKEIADDGALYFDISSIDDFSKKLYSICIDNDLRAELILSGKKRINSFSWKNSALRTLAIYEELRDN